MRWHIEWKWPVFGIAIWLDWLRPRHKPVVYWFWLAGHGRLFKDGDSYTGPVILRG